MAAMAFKMTINSNLNTKGVHSLPPNKLHSHLLPSNKKFCGHRILGRTPISLTRSVRCWHGSLVVSNSIQSSASKSFDVVIVGAGIIGLTIARHLLLASDLSVALVDVAVPCSGATGAGQGYIWKAHKSPGTEKWELMMRSHQLWESLANSIQLQGMDPLEVLGWKKTGSSRQLVGFNTEVDESVINHIWQRAGEFIPALRHESLEDLRQSREIRVGLRPYIPDGKPVIGLVPGFPNVFLAAGHEGEGLSLALGTAEMIADMVLGNSCKVDAAPFALLGRCFH